MITAHPRRSVAAWLGRPAHRATIALISLSLLSAACSPTAPAPSNEEVAQADAGGARPGAPDGAARTSPAPDHRPNLQSPIVALASALAAGGLTWPAADAALPGVTLRALEDRPVGVAQVKRARVVLPGYGNVELPKGAGVTATTVRGDEGTADLTLYGSEATVERVSLIKHYAEADAREFVARVLPGFELAPTPSACPDAATSDGAPAIFEARRPGAGRPLHTIVRIDNDAKYGPPTTSLDIVARPLTDAERACPLADDQGAM